MPKLTDEFFSFGLFGVENPLGLALHNALSEFGKNIYCFSSPGERDRIEPLLKGNDLVRNHWLCPYPLPYDSGPDELEDDICYALSDGYVGLHCIVFCLDDAQVVRNILPGADSYSHHGPLRVHGKPYTKPTAADMAQIVLIGSNPEIKNLKTELAGFVLPGRLHYVKADLNSTDPSPAMDYLRRILLP